MTITNKKTLKEIREMTNLSEAKFAKEFFNKSRSWVRSLEDGVNELMPADAEIYIKVAAAYGRRIFRMEDLYKYKK